MDGQEKLKIIAEVKNHGITLLDESKVIKGDFLGKGQFSVFKGKYFDDDVAIKEIPIDKANAEIASLLQEVDMSVKTTHQRVPKFYGIFVNDVFVCLVFSLIKGAKSLSDVCKTVDPKQQIEYLIQLISIINDLHGLNIIHRDLKPVNVVINEDNVLYLIDFGTSKFSSGTTTGTLDPKGTTFYMAPENFEYLFDGEDEENENEEKEDEDKQPEEKPYKISVQVDIWSLGCIISEIVSGIIPWHNYPTKKKVDHFLVMNLLNSKKDFPIPDNIKDDLKEILKGCFMALPKERLKVGELLEKMQKYRNSL